MSIKEGNIAESSIRDLISLATQGDNKAFDDLWKEINPFVHNRMRQGIDADTADELTSEVCTRLYEGKLLKYRPEKHASFFAWLKRFSNNLKINALKKRRPENFSAVPKDKDIEGKPAPESKNPLWILVDAEDEAVRERAAQILPKLMMKLSLEERYVIQAGVCDGHTDKEIAIIFSNDETRGDTYRKIRVRAIAKLKRMFRREGVFDFPIRK
jgi:RNA polymerase sigma factor (sigma-70 family)